MTGEREVILKVKVTGLPPRQGSRMVSDWPTIAAALKAVPNEWVLVPDFEQTHRARAIAASVASKRPPVPLMELGGVVKTALRNGRTIDDQYYADVYLRWTPENTDEV